MNDDIKKFINLSNLYTEVEVQKSEKLEEGFIDWVKGLAGLDDKSITAAVDELLDVPEVEATVLDDAVDDNNLEANSETTPRPTENDEGDPYDIINARQQVKAGEVGAQARLDRGLAELKSDQEAWDKENPGAAGSTGPTTRPNNRPTDDTPKITAEIQAELEKRGLDKGIIGEPLTPEDIAALKQPVPSATRGIGQAGAQAGTDDADDATIATEPAQTQAGTDDADDATIATEPTQTGTDARQTPGNATDDGGLGQRPAPAAQEPAAQEPAQPAAPSNGSLLGRKLDTTTPNLMKAYNAGGKQAMPAVKNMQTALSRLGFDPNGLDGKYGPGTFKAVQEFQKANGLSVDGQAGPRTMAAIKKALDDNFENNKVTPADTAQAAAPRSNASDDPAETGSTGAQPRANSAVNTRAAAPTTQTASKDNNMNKNKINEASMNISMNGNDASEVADLVKLLQNAGMPQAGPVSDIPMPMPKALPTPHDHDSHDNMKSMMTLMNEPEEDAPCGEDCGCDSCATEDTSEYDAVVSEWDNSPEEEYSDISAVLPDGDDLHKSKKPYPAVNGGDNAMALESIKETLWAALQEKATTEGRGRGKKTLKASRGNEDIKTTEGSRGKKSRGKKKSRG